MVKRGEESKINFFFRVGWYREKRNPCSCKAFLLFLQHGMKNYKLGLYNTSVGEQPD